MEKNKTWKWMLTGVLGVGLLLSGCSNGGETGGSSKQAGAEASDSAQKILIIARQSDANNLDPHFISAINAASVVHHKVYEGLIQRDESMEFKPMLATEWKQVDDVTWEFRLRQDVKFHDGTPFNAEAVKTTIARVLDEKVGSPRATQFKMIKEVKAKAFNLLWATTTSRITGIPSGRETCCKRPIAWRSGSDGRMNSGCLVRSDM